MIDNYFLPSDSTKKVLVATIFVGDGDHTELATDLIRVLACSGYHPDAIRWGMTSTDCILCLYKTVPCLDIFNHLHPC
jgi:hypothetical protein